MFLFLLLISFLSISFGNDVSGATYLPLRSFSLQSPYIDEQLGNRWWDFGGSTIVEVNNFVRLTPDVSSKAGWLFTKLPFTSQSWQIEFQFHIHGHGSTLFGDGFAFWYTKDKASVGPVFGNKDMFEGLGIFFDTYANGRKRSQFPYVMAMIGDGKTQYDLSEDGSSNEIGGCYSELRDSEEAKAKITYLREVNGGTLKLELDIRADDQWRECFSVGNVVLPAVGYIGFSALTGDITDSHDILRVDTHGIIMSNQGSQSSGSQPYTAQPKISIPSPSSKKSSGSWFKTLLKVIFAVVLLITIILCILRVTKRDSRKSSKRF